MQEQLSTDRHRRDGGSVDHAGAIIDRPSSTRRRKCRSCRSNYRPTVIDATAEVSIMQEQLSTDRHRRDGGSVDHAGAIIDPDIL
jgi:hypothetical protein